MGHAGSTEECGQPCHDRQVQPPAVQQLMSFSRRDVKLNWLAWEGILWMFYVQYSYMPSAVFQVRTGNISLHGLHKQDAERTQSDNIPSSIR